MIMLLSLIPTFLDACLDVSVRPIRPQCPHLSIPCLAPHIRDIDCIEARCPHHSSCRLCTSSDLPSTFTSLKKCIGLFVWDCIPDLVALAIVLAFQNWSLVEQWRDWHENWYCKNQLDEFEERVEEVGLCVLELKAMGVGNRERIEGLKMIERANERMIEFYIGVRREVGNGVLCYADIVRSSGFRAYYTRWSLVCLERARKLAAAEHRERVESWVGEIRGDRPTRVRKRPDINLSVEGLERLSGEEKLRYARAFVSKADALYSKCSFVLAEEFYTKAIGLMGNPDKGAEPFPDYLGALAQRARAREALGKLEGAFQDYTAASMLANSQDLGLVMDIERVLAPLVGRDADKLMKERGDALPSLSRVSAMFETLYFQAPQLPDTPSQGDIKLGFAFEALHAENYPLSFSLVNEALNQDISYSEGITALLILRGALRLLCGSTGSAQADLHSATLFSAHPPPAAAIVLALTYLAVDGPLGALGRLNEALKHYPQNPEILYHRGLILLNRLDEFNEAVVTLRSCISSLKEKREGGRESLLELAYADLGLALYRAGEVARAFEILGGAEKDYPESGEVLVSHAECLRHEGRFEEALAKCDKAIAIEKRRRYPNALCLVIKGSTIDQWTQDAPAVEACFLEALELDDENTVAMDALARSYAKREMREEAIELRKRQANMAREERELVRVMRERYILEAQVNFLETFYV